MHLPHGILTLDEQFFVQLVLKNELLDQEDVDECIRKKISVRKKTGVDRYIAEIFLDEELLDPEEVDEIHEAQAASQILRLDSLYGDIARKQGLVSQPQLEKGFETQRERGYQVRLGEILIEHGVLTMEIHRSILARLLSRIEQQEREYIRKIRVRKRYTEEVEAYRDEESSASEAPTEIALAAVDSAAPSESEAEPLFTSSGPSESELLSEAELSELSESASRSASNQGFALTASGSAGVLPELKPDSGIAEFHRPPPGETPADPAPFLAQNIERIKTEATKKKKPFAAGAPVKPRKKKSKKKPPKGRMEDFLTSAIQERETSTSPIRSVFLETEIHNLKTEIKNVENILAGSDTDLSSQIGMLSQVQRPVFDAKAYIRKKRAKSRLRQVVTVGAIVLVVAALVALLVLRWRNLGRYSEARSALSRGDLDASAERLAQLEGFWGTLWVSGDDVAGLEEDLAFETAFTEQYTVALESGDHDSADNALKMLAAKFSGAEYQRRIEDGFVEVRFRREMAAGQLLFEEGNRALALGHFREAQKVLDDGEAAAAIAALKTELEEAIAAVDGRLKQAVRASESDPTALRTAQAARSELIALYNEWRTLFKDDPGVEDKVAMLQIEQWIQTAEEALQAEDYDLAVEWYQNALELRPDDADLKFMLNRAQRLKLYHQHLDAGEELMRQERYSEAIETFERAKPFSDDPHEVEAQIVLCEERIAERALDQRYDEARSRGVAAFRASRMEDAAEAFEEMLTLKPGDPDATALVGFIGQARGMVFIPAGDFTMGVDSSRSFAYPEHRASVGRGYLIARHEVSNEEYAAFVAATPGLSSPRNWNGGTKKRGDGSRYDVPDSTYARHPVVFVSWTEAAAYCAWLGRRLPSEREWEKAARGTDGRTYPWGDEYASDLANVQSQVSVDEGVGTVTVGSSPGDVSPYGVRDMAGNVSEWVEDKLLPYPGAPERQVSSSDRERRVLRGGSWYYDQDRATCFYRQRGPEDQTWQEVGFRTALDIPELLRALLQE